MNALNELNDEGRKVFALREAATAEIETDNESGTAWNAWDDAASAFGETLRRSGFTTFDLEPQAADSLCEPLG